ncbi:MAG TPA: hypothetical protein VLH56_08675 [Dissulfurispiraceae bacterium]|nr:hypothetical protein [Dissulfurispiraceae bacterium]
MNNWDAAVVEVSRLRYLLDRLFDERADAEVIAAARKRLAEAEAVERAAWIAEQSRAAFCHCADCQAALVCAVENEGRARR